MLFAVSPDPGDTLIVLDASGSMRGRIAGETKMEIAKQAVRDLVNGLPDGTRLGLVVYGHRQRSACDDIELLVPAGPLDRPAFLAVVENLQPRGMTPLAAAITFAADALAAGERKANVILVTDGLETCGRDPCATARALEQAGVDFTLHAVAFDLGARETRSIACIAEATGGRLWQAKDAGSLRDALELTVATVSAPAPPPAEVISPATVTGPAEVAMGARFSVTWTGPDNPGDVIAVVRAGTPDGEYEDFTYTRRGSPLELTAPLDAGPAELRYLAGRSRRVLVRTPLVIVPAPVALTAAEQVGAGARVMVSWVGPNHVGDYVTIVPKGSPDDDYAAFAGTQLGSPLGVTAPLDPGPAEIRYVSGRGGRVLARREIDVVAAEVSLEAPAEVVAGTRVSIAWTGPGRAGDVLTVVAAGTPDGYHGSYTGTNAGSPLTVQAPFEVGEAEIRYLSGQGGRVLARRPLRIVAAAVTLTAPAAVASGAAVAVTWSGPGNAGDYLTIVPKAYAEGRHGRVTPTTAGSPLTVIAPIEVGAAELRYVSGRDNRVLARRDIEVTPPAK